MKRVLVSLLVLITMGGWLLGCSSQPGENGISERPEVGKIAPSFQLTGLDGKAVSLDGLRGKPVLLNFWATW